jgi:hypothetical protein
VRRKLENTDETDLKIHQNPQNMAENALKLNIRRYWRRKALHFCGCPAAHFGRPECAEHLKTLSNFT